MKTMWLVRSSGAPLMFYSFWCPCMEVKYPNMPYSCEIWFLQLIHFPYYAPHQQMLDQIKKKYQASSVGAHI